MWVMLDLMLGGFRTGVNVSENGAQSCFAPKFATERNVTDMYRMVLIGVVGHIGAYFALFCTNVNFSENGPRRGVFPKIFAGAKCE